MSLLNRLRTRVRDVRTINALWTGAERHARGMGEERPGAEHLLLAALDLPDGSAGRAFERLGAAHEELAAAILARHAEALQGIGVDAGTVGSAAAPIAGAPRGVMNAQPSGRAAFQRVYDLAQRRRDRPLLGAHVVHAVAEMEHGVVARTLDAIGIDRAALARAAEAEAETTVQG